GDECHHEADHGTRLGQQRPLPGTEQHSTSTLRSRMPGECHRGLLAVGRPGTAGTPAPPQPGPVLRSRRENRAQWETTLGNILIAFRENRRRTSTLTAVFAPVASPAETIQDISGHGFPPSETDRRSTKTPVPRSDPRHGRQEPQPGTRSPASGRLRFLQRLAEPLVVAQLLLQRGDDALQRNASDLFKTVHLDVFALAGSLHLDQAAAAHA